MKRGGAGERLLIAIGPWLAAGLIRLLARSMRIEYLGLETVQGCRQRGEHLLLSFWHDELLLMVKGYRGASARILISASRDGELIARTMQRFGHEAVRGSSHRGGRAAFRALVELGREPYDIGITPDGPRGPRHQIKDGIVELARITGRPVMPLTFVCSRGHRFASWDRFLLPYPFARGVFCYGPPLYFGKGDDPQRFHHQLQQAMDESRRRAQAHLESYGLSAV